MLQQIVRLVTLSVAPVGCRVWGLPWGKLDCLEVRGKCNHDLEELLSLPISLVSETREVPYYPNVVENVENTEAMSNGRLIQG